MTKRHIGKTRRRTVLKTIGASVTVGLAGCGGDSGDGSDGSDGSGSSGSDGSDGSGSSGSDGSDGSGGSDGGSTDGSSGPSPPYDIGMVTMGMSQQGLFTQNMAGQWMVENSDLSDSINLNIANGQLDPTKQTQDGLNFVNQGVDALLIMPIDSNGARQIVERASEEDIPVMSYAITANHNEVDQYISFNSVEAGRMAGERMVELLREKNGEPSGQVITSVWSPESTASQQRTRGFMEAIEPHPIEDVTRVVSDATASDTQPKVYNALQRYPEIDAIYSNNQGSGLGAVQALERFERLHTKDHDDHVILTQVDGGPEINQYINDGYVDFGADQPLHYYTPIGVTLLKRYLDEGKDPSVIPSVGDTIEDEDLLPSPSVFGFEPWGSEYYQPVNIIEYENEDVTHPWFETQTIPITEDNAMSDNHWGTLYRQASEAGET